MKRLHTTDEKQINLNHKYEGYNSSRDWFKPRGLWYGLDDAWFEWCSGENFDGIGKNTFEISVNTFEIITISNKAELLAFYEKYKVVRYEYLHGIDWLRVKQDFKGIEIQNYHDMRWCVLPANGDTWYYGWDCDSGCIWDLSAITSIKKVEYQQTA